MRKHFTPEQAAEAAQKIRNGTKQYDFTQPIPKSGSTWALKGALKDALRMEAACEARTVVLNEFDWCPEEGVSREVILDAFVRALMCQVDEPETHQGRCQMIDLIQRILS